jgi:hypothetical protein
MVIGSIMHQEQFDSSLEEKDTEIAQALQE